MTKLRLGLAFVCVTAGLIAAAAALKAHTCACAGALPYGAITLWAGLSAGGALASYVVTGLGMHRD